MVDPAPCPRHRPSTLTGGGSHRSTASTQFCLPVPEALDVVQQIGRAPPALWLFGGRYEGKPIDV